MARKASINIIMFFSSRLSSFVIFIPPQSFLATTLCKLKNVSVLPIGIVFSLFDLISGILDKIVIIIIETPFKTRKGKWCILAFAQLYPLFWAKQSFLFFFVLSKLVGNDLCCHLIQLHIEHVLLSFYVKQEKAIELLVEHGADLDSRTPYGESPLGMG